MLEADGNHKDGVPSAYLNYAIRAAGPLWLCRPEGGILTLGARSKHFSKVLLRSGKSVYHPPVLQCLWYNREPKTVDKKDRHFLAQRKQTYIS